MDNATNTGSTQHKDKLRIIAQSDKLRFSMDLEFLELLADPAYINYLASSSLLKDEAFINYLEYLQVRGLDRLNYSVYNELLWYALFASFL